MPDDHSLCLPQPELTACSHCATVVRELQAQNTYLLTRLARATQKVRQYQAHCQTLLDDQAALVRELRQLRDAHDFLAARVLWFTTNTDVTQDVGR